MASKQNFAAWAPHRKAEHFVVKENTYTAPGAGEIVVRNHALGINPIDWMLQDEDVLELPYPNIFGCDVAGKVVELGPGVSGFEIGQRVMG